MKSLTLTVFVMVLASCSATEVHYVNACPSSDTVCQRNLNAQTLSIIGQEEAALELLCSDPGSDDIIRELCSSR